MEYAREELRFAADGWSSGQLVTGAVGSGARGVVVRPADLVVTHTLIKRSRRRVLRHGSQVVGDASTPLQPDAVRLTRGVRVLRGAARVGRVRALWCDRASGQIMHVLVKPGGGLAGGPERVLAVEQLSGVAKNALVLLESAPDLEQLPPYRPDKALVADLRAILAEALPAPSARRGVKTLVEDGQVHLAGAVETEEEVARARHAAERIRGVRGLVLDLVSTETLADRVEQRLAAVLAAATSLPHPAPTGAGEPQAAVRVLAEHGIVYLEGSAPTSEMRAVLERATLTVAGARVVVNNLTVDAPPMPIPSHQPAAAARSVEPSSALIADAGGTNGQDAAPDEAEATGADMVASVPADVSQRVTQ
jgi:osmotically-inducible protein OsmY